MDKKSRLSNVNKKTHVLNIWYILAFILYTIVVSIRVGFEYFFSFYETSLEALLFTLKAPKINANTDVINSALSWCLPRIVPYFIFFITVTIGLIHISRYFNISKWIYSGVIFGFSFVLVINTAIHVNSNLKIDEYLKKKSQKTTIYEDYYVNPNEVEIVCNDSVPNNLIYIYLESIESQNEYYDKKQGKYVDLTPNLTELAKNNINFSESDEVGGFYSPKGTDWTMGALFSTSSGIPFMFPIDGNDMTGRKSFSPKLVTLGDILEQNGYVQEFCCGSDLAYGGRELYYSTHGNWKFFDFFDAYPGGWDEYNIGWWGIEDAKLYEYAKNELNELAKHKEPFNFTLLTVDTHFGDWVSDGYICQLCDDVYEDRYANVISCADRQLSDFVEWIQKQDFYKNTTIVITGDHPFMGKQIKENKPNGYTVYNCVINSRKETSNNNQRNFTSFDMFPTVISSLGFDIEGNRLGLGTDLFSEQQTISEQIGFDKLNNELTKYSQYYIDNFE